MQAEGWSVVFYELFDGGVPERGGKGNAVTSRTGGREGALKVFWDKPYAGTVGVTLHSVGLFPFPADPLYGKAQGGAFSCK